jgi:hypothetical protein
MNIHLDQVPGSEESFVTCCEQDWELHLQSFARNLHSEFDTDNSITSADSSIRQEIVVMAHPKKSGRKQKQKARPPREGNKDSGSRGSVTNSKVQRKRKKSDFSQEMDEEDEHRTTQRRKPVTQNSDDEDSVEQDSVLDSKADEGVNYDEDEDEDEERSNTAGDEDEDEDEERSNAEVTPEGLNGQRGSNAASSSPIDDDDDSFDNMSFNGQVCWLNEKILAIRIEIGSVS